jgi:hypothetical protein
MKNVCYELKKLSHVGQLSYGLRRGKILPFYGSLPKFFSAQRLPNDLIAPGVVCPGPGPVEMYACFTALGFQQVKIL